MELKVYLTDPERLARGKLDFAMTLFQDNPGYDGWTFIDTVNIDLDPFIEVARSEALLKLKKEKKEIQAATEVKMREIDERIGKLMALPQLEVKA